jgi:hypothetical protein
MPLVGIMESAKSGNLYSNSFESIQSTIVGAGGSASVTFTSIPATYQHLQIRYIARNSEASTNAIYFLTGVFNSDTGGNYTSHYYSSDGASLSAAAATGVGSSRFGTINSTAYSSTAYTHGVIDIVDYANTNKYKTSKSVTGTLRSATNNTSYILSTAWLSTSAISSISLAPGTGNFVQYSNFALYGIKG